MRVLEAGRHQEGLRPYYILWGGAGKTYELSLRCCEGGRVGKDKKRRGRKGEGGLYPSLLSTPLKISRGNGDTPGTIGVNTKRDRPLMPRGQQGGNRYIRVGGRGVGHIFRDRP